MIPEQNRLQAVLATNKDVVGVAAGRSMRISVDNRQVQDIQRTGMVQMPLVNAIARTPRGLCCVGGSPGQNGMQVHLNPVSLVMSSHESIGRDCLTGCVVLDGMEIVVNAKGGMFTRAKGETWLEKQIHQGACNGIISIGQKHFVTFGADGIIHCWDATFNRISSLEGHSGSITDGIVNPDGTLVTVSSDRSLRVWDPVRGRQRMFSKDFENALHSVQLVAGAVVAIDVTGQVLLLSDALRPAKVGINRGTPCRTWVSNIDPSAIYIAQRYGTIHRIGIEK